MGEYIGQKTLTPHHLNEATSVVSIPKGTIVAHKGSSIPDGWAICDGANGTPDLRGRFIIGAVNRKSTDSVNIDITSLNEDGSAQDPRVPYHHLTAEGKPRSLIDQLAFLNEGESGGAASHKLDLSELPSHQHSGKTNLDGEHQHTYYAVAFNIEAHNKQHRAGNKTKYTTPMDGKSKHQHAFTTDLTGGDKYHNNLPPYYALVYIIKL